MGRYIEKYWNANIPGGISEIILPVLVLVDDPNDSWYCEITDTETGIKGINESARSSKEKAHDDAWEQLRENQERFYYSKKKSGDSSSWEKGHSGTSRGRRDSGDSSGSESGCETIIAIILLIIIVSLVIEWCHHGKNSPNTTYTAPQAFNNQTQSQDGENINRGQGNKKDAQKGEKALTQTLRKGCKYGDCINGQGEYENNGKVYKGSFLNGEFSGYGILICDGLCDELWSKYDGYFMNGQMDGPCIVTYKDGSRFGGTFRNNKAEGNGEMTFANGIQFKGQYVNGKPQGQGYLKYIDGSSKSGDFKDTMLINGTFTYYSLNNQQIKIEYRNGFPFNSPYQKNQPNGSANPYGPGKGQVSLWSRGNEEFTITVDHKFSAKINSHFPNNDPTCGENGTYCLVLDERQHTFIVRAISRQWGGNFYVTSGQCISVQFDKQ